MRRPVIALVPLLLASTACGTTVVDDDDEGGGGGASTTATASSTATGPGDAPRPTALYVSDREGCGIEAPISEAEASLTRDGETGLDEVTMVVQLVFADECTGAGGQHILARATDGGEMMWLGAHACHFFDAELVDGRVHGGVVRAFEDDHGEEIPDGVCITFPGEDGPIASDLGVLAVAVFPTVEDAEAFVASIDG